MRALLWRIINWYDCIVAGEAKSQ